jgi:hypothetical protein
MEHMAQANQTKQTAQAVNAPSDVGQLLAKWLSTAREYAHAHLMEAVALKKLHWRIGGPSVAISIIVGTSIFADMQGGAQSVALKCLLSLLSVSAAVLAGIVTFYNYAERSTRHKIASEEYEDTARRLEILQTSITKMRPTEWRNVLDGFSQRLEAIGKRVDLPASMTVTVERVSELKAFTGKGRIVKHTEQCAKLPRDGFPEELDRVFHLAQQASK